MSDKIERPNVEYQPHAVADIYGRKEKDLKQGERLQFLTDEELDYIQIHFSYPNVKLTDYLDRSVWPRDLSHLSVWGVVIANDGGFIEVPGVLHTLSRWVVGGARVVMDLGHKGVVEVMPQNLRVMTKQDADREIPTWQRRQGHRLVRAMRDIGSVPGKEDIALLNILKYSEFLGSFLEHKKRYGALPFLSEGLKFEMSFDYAWTRASRIKMPDKMLIGERCVWILLNSGVVHAGEVYQGMYRMLRQLISDHKEVEEISKDVYPAIKSRMVW